MINRVYSLLLEGQSPSRTYYDRKVSPVPNVNFLKQVYTGQLLVPSSTDEEYKAYCAEQLIQVVCKSDLLEDLNAFDPLNNYNHGGETVAKATSYTSLPSGLAINLLEPDTRHNWVAKLLTINVSPTADTVEISGIDTQVLGWSGTISAPVILTDGVKCVFNGTLPGTSFGMTASIVRPPDRNIKTLIDTLKHNPLAFRPEYEEYRLSRNVNNWLAAAVMNYCKVVTYGTS